MVNEWENIHGEKCILITEVWDGERKLIVFKKNDVGGYHWSYDIEEELVLLSTDWKKR